MKEIIEVKTISEAHDLLSIRKPRHPLVSVIDAKDLAAVTAVNGLTFRIDLYQIWMKDGVECEIGYGRNSYDFREGTLAFMKPGQIITGTEEHPVPEDAKGWLLIFHPDLIRKSELGKTIHQYSFFDYEVFEALHVSEDEQNSLTEIAEKIAKEIQTNTDRFSQKLIVSNVELLLDYCARYYNRQFYTRTNFNQDLVTRFEKMLRAYYADEKQLSSGIPTVKYCGEQMNMSAHYLSDLLRKETGKNAQEHIHAFITDMAKTALLGTGENVAQIAYTLGFQYPQHFTKLFKSKTGFSPAEYRNLN
ncbi:MAG: helix-turn-helix domain-containing protein [Bacteroidetes bacterium]|nr:helix-turn-helix domain-containing protein [Bacteroidota bacterium]